MPTAQPTSGEERLEHIDLVRGYALLGVLLMNIQYWFRNPPQPYWMGQHPFPGALNLAADHLLRVWFEAKSVTLFSMLFALGLCIQRERVLEKGLSWGIYAIRRLFALLIFGALHIVLVWNGDILHIYAIMGLLFFPFLGRSKKAIAWWLGVLLGLAVLATLGFSIVQMLRPPAGPRINPNQAELVDWAQACIRGYQDPSWIATLRFRLWDYQRLMLSPIMLFFALFTLVNFLIGLWAWKQGAIKDLPTHRRTIGRWALVLLLVGLAMNVTGDLGRPLGDWVRSHWTFGRLLLPWIGLSQVLPFQTLALGLACGLMWAWTTGLGHRLLRPLTFVGRMAFTNYLTQSLVCTFVFYGWGLGYYNRVGPMGGLAFGLALFGLQIAFSRWWLARYPHGPMEWVWRSLTYGRLEPLRRISAAS